MMTLAGLGSTVTDPTGAGVTPTDVVPLLLSLVAVIVTVPGATPVTTPADDTLAIALLLDDHVTTRFVTTVPFASFTVIVGVVVCPTTTELLAGCSVTLPTGIGTTVTADDPLFPSLVAVIVADPIASAVTTLTEPLADTLTAALLELHTTPRSVRTVPFASLTVAVNGAVWPTRRLAVAGRTVTVPTGTGTTVTVIVPLFPSLVAVIVVGPSATPETTPAEDTVAAVVLLELHVTTRSVTTVPLVSFTIGLSVVV
jgi:hypothetical protein